MATDRARNSYDPSRGYRSVVAQQGRVTVEADPNEAEQIRAAESRAQLVDVIGPTGTPDDGFLVTLPAGGTPFDFSIGAGTLYVGGLRVHNDDAALTYTAQSQGEWLDAGSPDPDMPTAGPVQEVVYLELTEREVTATEDEALREVALGGPDTSARTRLVQRVRRATASSPCEDGLVEVLAKTSPGLAFDPDTRALTSKGLLQVGFVPTSTTSDPCQPIAQSAFLGAENQLVRVQVAADGSLVWAYDNASALYRAKPPTGTTRTLELLTLPVDELHRPRPGQRLEVLRAAVALDTRGDAFVTRLVGDLHDIASYDPTNNAVTVTTDITDFDANPLFVRVWENKLAATATPTELVDALHTGTGVTVALTGTAAPGDYWMVGLRPSYPDRVYPARLAQPQPPDGPRRWATPLATIAWNADGRTGNVDDCRRPFRPLTEDGDLEFHNKHLHGWGVVCGLQVRCMTQTIATQKQLPRPREWVTVFRGYAIDPDGHDIRLDTGARDKYIPLDVGSLAVTDHVLDRDANGKLSDGSVSLWIDRDRRFHLEKFTPKKSTWQDLLDGTLLGDIYKDCIGKILEFVKGSVTPGAHEGPVGPAQKRMIAALNLLVQLGTPAGRHVFLARDEHEVLAELFEGLKRLLESTSFCAIYEGLDFPKYDIYRDGLPAGGSRPTTIFGTGRHQRLRVHSQRKLAFTCTVGAEIHAYDLGRRGYLATSAFPERDAWVQDVAFSPKGDEIFAIAWVGTGHAESVFAAGKIERSGEISWGAKVRCPLRLVTLATSKLAAGKVFAAARGQGVYVFDMRRPDAQPEQVLQMRASGHLVASDEAREKIFLYAGENTDDKDQELTSFTQIRGVLHGHEGAVYRVPPLANAEHGYGHDDLALAFGPQHKVDELYAIVDADGGEKRLLVWKDRKPGLPSTIVPLGASAASRIAYSPAGNWSLVTYESTFVGRAYRPGSNAVETEIHPLQIGPISVATDEDGTWFFVLEWLSQTITALPARPAQGEPWRSEVDIPKLEAYRDEAILAYVKLLGRLVQYLKDCACDHLLVNCPDGRDKKVYLADITFRDGAVYQICNFHHRKYVHTFPTVEYWMSLVPALPLLKEQIHRVCCTIFKNVFDTYATSLAGKKEAWQVPLSVTELRNGLTYLLNLDVKQLLADRKLQLFADAKAALRKPPPDPPIAVLGRAKKIEDAPVSDEVTRLRTELDAMKRQMAEMKKKLDHL